MSEYYKKYIKYKNKYINLQTQMGGVLPATSEAELLRPRRMGNLQNAIPYVPPPMLQVTPNSNQAEKDAIIAEARRKREAIMNKLLGNTTELGDEPPPVVREGNPYSYDRDAIDKARELAEAQARIANRDYEDKVGLFKQAIKDKDDLKKDAQNKPYRESNHRWPYPEIVEQRIKDYDIITRNRPLDYYSVPRREGKPNHYRYDYMVEYEVKRLAEVLFRIAEYKVAREEQRIRDERVFDGKPVRDSPHRWPYPSIVRQVEEDENLVKANKEFLKANKDYLEKYNLYPTELLDIFYKLRESLESRPYVLHWMEDTAKKMYGEDGRGRKEDLKKYEEDFIN